MLPPNTLKPNKDQTCLNNTRREAQSMMGTPREPLGMPRRRVLKLAPPQAPPDPSFWGPWLVPPPQAKASASLPSTNSRNLQLSEALRGASLPFYFCKQTGRKNSSALSEDNLSCDHTKQNSHGCLFYCLGVLQPRRAFWIFLYKIKCPISWVFLLSENKGLACSLNCLL